MSVQTYQDKFDDFFNQITEEAGSTRGASDINKQEAYVISKKLSQLIAKSWLPNDPEGAEFRQIILRGDSEEIKNWLKNHDVDLEGFFQVSINIEVSWETFVGTLKETTAMGRLSTRSNTYTLPYPPRPAVVTDEQLEKWINDTNADNKFPLDPYIPLSSC
ncbi:MAG: hypothetical protein SAK29_11810 [Scytonema sp. PMC 1069.18]|nr:hypothetical protein [Scytonema sp. PMC 1069.18]MEC4884776.1 hypothetical protein [Scytonema sp. PMC 1070.18]